MGALPDTYTAYRRVDDEDTARLFEQAWGVPLSRQVGYKSRRCSTRRSPAI